MFGCLRNLIFKVIFSASWTRPVFYFYQNYFKIFLKTLAELFSSFRNFFFDRKFMLYVSDILKTVVFI